MGRRSVLLFCAGLLLLGAGLAAGGARGASAVVLQRAAFPTAAPTSTPFDPNEPSPSNGLGNTRVSIEKSLGDPTGLKGTMLAYRGGKYAFTFQGGRAVGVLVNLANERAGLDQARREVQAMLPTDRVLVGTMDSGPNRVEDIYQSARIGAKNPTPSTTVSNNQFVVVYEDDGTGMIRDALLLMGDVPKN